MRNNKGFTLAELLAVIVILALLGTVGIKYGLKAKRSSNIKTAKAMEENLTQLGGEILTNERMWYKNGDFYTAYVSGDELKITLEELKKKDYLEETTSCSGSVCLKSPLSGKTCDGFIYIKREDSKKATVKGYINCDGLYTTDGYDDAKNATEVSISEENVAN